MDDQPKITKEHLYRAAVGKRRENFYVPKFLEFEESDSRRSWNWAAVVFGPFWFLYRRMFVSAVLLGILAPAFFYWMCDVAIGLVLRASPQSWLWSVPSLTFDCLLIPIYANYLYFSSVEKRIGSLREKLPDDAAVLQALAGSRQTSVLILTRRMGETLPIGTEISVTVLGIKGNQVRIGINAPKDVAVHREEIYDRVQQEKAQQAE